MSLSNYFTDSYIIKLLCQYRAEIAKKRHDQQFLYNISTSAPEPTSGEKKEDSLICSLMPPRKQWIRPSYDERKKHQNILQGNAWAIEKTIIQKRKSIKFQQEPWLIQLNQFIEDIRYSALQDKNFKIESPRISLVKKEPKSNNHEYRPIASYKLKHRIIIGQCAKYLIDIFDKYFLDYSYAFRKNKLNHHQAIKDLIEYKASYDDQSLWVAECDIKGFFDCVHHDQARLAFNKAQERLEIHGQVVDNRAIEIFELYLQSYSFTKVAIPDAVEWFQKNDEQGHLKKIDKDLKQFWDNPLNEFIGIPQGGAISCIIANLMLDNADRQILNHEIEKKHLFYARYCDDMIVVHPDKESCENSFNRYQEALKLLKLPIHEPQEVIQYDREYWRGKSKSKLPYYWANKQENGAVPWIAFVGYQVRYDGLIRIRPSSIEKELKKQVEEANQVLKIVNSKNNSSSVEGQNTNSNTSNNTPVRKSKHQIRYRLHKRLISMSVGRVSINSLNTKKSGFCWSNGFQVLKGYPCIVKSQLRQLDRGREKQLRRVTKHIENLDTLSDSKQSKKDTNYYGKPFSYDGQFKSTIE
jgi:retron-type reverse transcriptase